MEVIWIMFLHIMIKTKLDKKYDQELQ